jgi:RNA polymerase sigma factor (sigma-70 family)
MMSERGATDAELLRGARSDPKAFRVLYDRHSRAVYGWLLARSGREDVALDLTAETFAEAFRLAGRFRPGAADARPWLIGIAANLLHSSWRHQRAEVRARERLGALEATRMFVDDHAEEVGERLDRSAGSARLAVAFADLPAGQRRAIEMRVNDGSSYAQIGEVLGCSTVAARVRVFRGLHDLKRILGGTQC